MASHDAGLVIVEKLVAAGIAATADPRSATPPCVVVAPSGGRLDTWCTATVTWALYAVAAGPANLDAWTTLDELLVAVTGVFPVESWEFVEYSLSPDNPAMPAYRITFTQGVDIR